MSRSGYSDDYEYLDLYRASVERATRGRRGQSFLRRLRDALEAMPVKRLIADQIVDHGEVCALGAVDPVATIDSDDSYALAVHFGIARALAAEIVYQNDEMPWHEETPEQRWIRMRAWVEEQIAKEPTSADGSI